MFKYLFLASSFASLPNIVKEELAKIMLPDLTSTLKTKFKIKDTNFLTLDYPDMKQHILSGLETEIKYLYESIKRLNDKVSDLVAKKAKYINFQIIWKTKKDSIKSSYFKISLDSAKSKYSLEKSPPPSIRPDQDPILINLVDFDEKMTVLKSN